MNEKSYVLYKDCRYGKTSGDFVICDLGVRETKVWGNTMNFSCIKGKVKDGQES